MLKLLNASGITYLWKQIKQYVSQASEDTLGEVESGYVKKVSGKNLSTNDFTNAYKSQLDGLNGKTPSSMFVTTVSVPYTSWTTNTDSQSETYYTKTISVTGLTSTGYPICDVVLSTDIAAARLQSESYKCIDRVSVNNGSVTFYCFDETPSVNLNVRIQIMYS